MRKMMLLLLRLRYRCWNVKLTLIIVTAGEVHLFLMEKRCLVSAESFCLSSDLVLAVR